MTPSRPAVDDLLARGHAALQAGHVAEAVRHLRAAVTQAADHAGAWHLFGIALERHGEAAGALAALRHALALAPARTDAAVQASDLLLRQGERQEAAACLQAAASAAAALDPVAARLCRARALGLLDHHKEAAGELRDLLAMQPQHSEAWRLLGNALAASGALAAARDAFRRAAELDPGNVSALLDLVRAGKVGEAERPLVARMAQELAQASGSPRRQVLLGFAVGKALDDLNDPAGAIRAFDLANAIRARAEPFDAAALTADVARIIAAFPGSPRAVAATRPDAGGAGVASPTAPRTDPPSVPAPPGSPDTTRAVCIVGMPRSGTTLVEQILSSHAAVAAGGEMAFWGECGTRWLRHGGGDPVAIRQEHARALARVSPDAARVTDKNPFNFAWLGLIRPVLPDAYIIHCRRDPWDVCLSAYMTLFTGGNSWAASRAGLASFWREYRRLMDHWRATLPAHRFLEIDYEAVVAEPQAAARRLVAFCDLPWDDACLHPETNARAVHTASVYQAREAVHARSVGRWRAYAPWLGELVSLAP